MVHRCGTSPVCLVHLVSLIQPNKPDRPNRPNEQGRLADFFSILLNQIRLRNSTDRGGSVTASEWGIPWEGTALV